MFGLFFAYLLLQHRLQQTESQSGLGRRSGLRDIDDTKLLVSQELHQLSQIVLTDIVSCVHYVRVLAILGYKRIECRSQSLIHRARTEVRTSDSCYDHYLAAFTQFICTGLHFCQESIGDRGGEMNPTDVVISGTLSVL